MKLMGTLGGVSEAVIENAGTSAKFKVQMLGEKPSWAIDTLKNRFKSHHLGMLKACLEALSSIKDVHPLQYVQTTILEGCRCDPPPTEVILQASVDVHPLQYVQTTIFVGCRSDPSLHEVIVDA